MNETITSIQQKKHKIEDSGISILDGLRDYGEKEKQANTPSNENKAAFQFDRVTFAYKSGEEVFRDATFSIPKGSMYFLTGASGAGKSSLMKLIYRAHKSYLGSIEALGQNLKKLSEQDLTAFRQKIGIVFQEFDLLDHLSTLDNVALPLTFKGVSLKNAQEQAAELLSWLGLGSYLHKNPTFLSGGQRQRISLARAVITDPEIILADEPTGHVDDENAAKIMALFESLNKKGKTILISTHNRAMVEALGAPEIRIKNGNVSTYKPSHKKEENKKITLKKKTKKISKKTPALKSKTPELKEVKNA